jgi:hypothetical protein
MIIFWSTLIFLLSSYSYAQCLPSRFKKDLIRAATSGDRIGMSGIQKVLGNIGAGNRLTETEIKTIFDKYGTNGEIPSKDLVQII